MLLMRSFDTHSPFSGLFLPVAFSVGSGKREGKGSKYMYFLGGTWEERGEASLFVYTGLGHDVPGNTDGFPVFD